MTPDRYVNLNDRSIDLLAMAVNSAALGVASFIFTLAGMSFAQVGANTDAALYAGLMSAGLRVSTYVLQRLGLSETEK